MEVVLEIRVNGEEVPANEFIKSMFWETLSGMVRSLRGVEPEIRNIEISVSKE